MKPKNPPTHSVFFFWRVQNKQQQKTHSSASQKNVYIKLMYTFFSSIQSGPNIKHCLNALGRQTQLQVTLA